MISVQVGMMSGQILEIELDSHLSLDDLHDAFSLARKDDDVLNFTDSDGDSVSINASRIETFYTEMRD